MTDPDPLTVNCEARLAPAGDPCFPIGPVRVHEVRIGDARAAARAAAAPPITPARSAFRPIDAQGAGTVYGLPVVTSTAVPEGGAVLIDLIDADLSPPPDDLILRALILRAGAYRLTVRITPADHAPNRALFPLRLELVDARDARRTIAGYTASDPAGASTGLRTLLAVLP